MSSITKYSTAKGDRWRVQYRTPENRVTQRRGFKTKNEAEDFAATVRVSTMRGEYVEPAAGRVTIGDLGPGWLARRGISSRPADASRIAPGATMSNHVGAQRNSPTSGTAMFRRGSPG